MDKAVENALNLGYNIRKEIDKIHPQTVAGKGYDDDLPLDVNAQVEKMIAGE